MSQTHAALVTGVGRAGSGPILYPETAVPNHRTLRRRAEELVDHPPLLRRVDRIEVDGRPLVQPRLRYIMLNKPPGYITTVSDERDRRTVMTLGTVLNNCGNFGIPLVLLGHSWGSLMAQIIINDHSGDYDAAVLTGTAAS